MRQGLSGGMGWLPALDNYLFDNCVKVRVNCRVWLLIEVFVRHKTDLRITRLLSSRVARRLVQFHVRSPMHLLR